MNKEMCTQVQQPCTCYEFYYNPDIGPYLLGKLGMFGIGTMFVADDN